MRTARRFTALASLATVAMLAPALPAAVADAGAPPLTSCGEWICGHDTAHGKVIEKRGLTFTMENAAASRHMADQQKTYIGAAMSVRISDPAVTSMTVVWEGGISYGTDGRWLGGGAEYVAGDEPFVYGTPITAHVTTSLADGTEDYASVSFDTAEIDTPFATFAWERAPKAGSIAKLKASLNPLLVAAGWDSDAGSYLNVGGIALPENSAQKWSSREFAIPGNAAGKSFEVGAAQSWQSAWRVVPGYNFVSSNTTGVVAGPVVLGTPSIVAPNNVTIRPGVKDQTVTSVDVVVFRDGIEIDRYDAMSPQYDPTILQTAQNAAHTFHATVRYRYVDGSTSPVLKTPTIKMPLIKGTALEATTSGTPTVMKTLSAKLTVVEPAMRTRTYQWYRNGVAIKGATKSTYALTASDAGKKITVKLTASATGYATQSITKTAATKVALAKLTNKGIKTTGTKRPGKTLRVATNKGWTAGTKFTYQWYRGGKAIKGATKTSLKLGRSDARKVITVTATATKSGYATVKVNSGRLVIAAR